MIKLLVIVLAMVSWSTASLAGNNGLMGALIGAGVGAGVGHAVDRTGGSGKGAIIGAIGGYVIGNQMDKREQSAAQSPVRSAQQTTRPGSSVHASAYDRGDCVSSDDYVDRAARSSHTDDRIYYLERAVKLCPNQARAHNDLGVAYYQRNQRHDRDRAKSEFNEALRIDPGYTVARNNLNNL